MLCKLLFTIFVKQNKTINMSPVFSILFIFSLPIFFFIYCKLVYKYL